MNRIDDHITLLSQSQFGSFDVQRLQSVLREMARQIEAQNSQIVALQKAVKPK